MRKLAFVGALLVLLLPFGVSNYSVKAPKSSTYGIYGLLYTGVHVAGTSSEDQLEFFKFSWWVDNNHEDVYEGYFATGPNDIVWRLGILILLLLISVISLAIFRSESKSSSVILIVCGLMLLLLRYRTLHEIDQSYYTTYSDNFIEYTYWEIPLGCFLSLIFGILDLRK